MQFSLCPCIHDDSGCIFLDLPAELREQVYEFIALSHTTRLVITVHNESVGTLDHKITTSAIAATCRLIHEEYEDVARKATKVIEFTTVDMNLEKIQYYFHRRIDAKYLTTLRQSKALIKVAMVVYEKGRCEIDLEDFFTWALFLIDVKVEAAYFSDQNGWANTFMATDCDLAQRVQDELIISRRAVRENLDEIARLADVFDKAVWLAYADPKLRREVQLRRRREWDCRVAKQRAVRDGQGYEIDND